MPRKVKSPEALLVCQWCELADPPPEILYAGGAWHGKCLVEMDDPKSWRKE